MWRGKSTRLLKRALTALALLLTVVNVISGQQLPRGSLLTRPGYLSKWTQTAGTKGVPSVPLKSSEWGEVSANQKDNQQLDVECVSLSQPLQAIVALPLQEDIFTRCSSMCSASGSGDVIIISISGMQATCGCAFLNLVASRVTILDKGLCDMSCGVDLNLPCGSSTVYTTASMYSLPSLVTFLSQSSNSGDNISDSANSEKSTGKSKHKRSGPSTAAITGIAIALVTLVGLIILAILKLPHIIKRRKMKKYGENTLERPYNASEDQWSGMGEDSRSDSTFTKSNFSNITKGESLNTGTLTGINNLNGENVSQTLPEVHTIEESSETNVAKDNTTFNKPNEKETFRNKSKGVDGLYLEMNELEFLNGSLADAIMNEGKLHENPEKSVNKGIALNQDVDTIENAGVRAEKINRTLQNTTLSRPAVINKKKAKASTVPRKSSMTDMKKDFHITDRLSQYHKKSGKSSHSGHSKRKKDGPRVKIREDFVIPRKNKGDEDTFSQDYLDAYKKKLFSERRAFDAAYGADNVSDEDKNENKLPKLTPSQQVNISKASVDSKSSFLRDDLCNNAESTLHKNTDGDNLASSNNDNLASSNNDNLASSNNDNLASSNNNSATSDEYSNRELNERPREPSINFQTPIEILNPNSAAKDKSYSPENDPPTVVDSSRRESVDQNQLKKDPKRLSVSKTVIANKLLNKKPLTDYHKYNQVVVNKKQPPIDKRTTYLSMKLKSIQLNPDDDVIQKDDKDVMQTNSSFIDEYRLPHTKTNEQKITDSESGGDGDGIDRVEALLDMGLVGKTDFKTRGRRELEDLDHQTSQHVASGRLTVPSINRNSNENRDVNGTLSSKNIEKPSKRKSKRISAAFTRMSGNVARRSSNIRDSLIKKLNDGIVSIPSKSSSSKNSQYESQNDYFILSESDSKQNT